MMAERPAASPGSRGRKIKYINLNQLRSFFAVAEHLSFTRAARSLNVGQPTITTQVRALEERYGVELFQRLPGRERRFRPGADRAYIDQRRPEARRCRHPAQQP
ncbi:MAG TPA: LysR family transcriptional regulator, partial [Vineibacter sp.]|nr:LysR family transcriptional regulator [Vineibacter sp.]